MRRDSFLRKLARPFVRRARIAMREFQARRQSPFGAAKFEQRPPSHANAIDIFTGCWAADLSQFDPNWRGVADYHGHPHEWRLGTIAENPVGFVTCSLVLGLGLAGSMYCMYRSHRLGLLLRERRAEPSAAADGGS